MIKTTVQGFYGSNTWVWFSLKPETWLTHWTRVGVLRPTRSMVLKTMKQQTQVKTLPVRHRAGLRNQDPAVWCWTEFGPWLTPGLILVHGQHPDRDDRKHGQGDGKHAGHTQSHQPDLCGMKINVTQPQRTCSAVRDVWRQEENR